MRTKGIVALVALGLAALAIVAGIASGIASGTPLGPWPVLALVLAALMGGVGFYCDAQEAWADLRYTLSQRRARSIAKPSAAPPQTPEAATTDVFVSYSHADKPWVAGTLLPQLDKAGVVYCLDEQDFEFGKPVLANMEQAVMRARHTLAILSPAYLASGPAMFESLLTQTQDPTGARQRLIPIMIADCFKLLPPRLGYLWIAKARTASETARNLPRVIEIIKASRPPTKAEPQPAKTPWPPPIYVPPPGGTQPDWYVARLIETSKVLSALGLIPAACASGAQAEATPRAVGLTAAVQGMAGVGKSTLAAALLSDERVRERFKDGVLWATLGPEATTEGSADHWLLRWGQELGADLAPYSTPALRSSVLCGLLGDKQVLLVVDDVWAAQPARALLAAAGPQCGRLFTTRLLDVALALDNDPVRVDLLSEPEALELLRLRASQALRGVPEAEQKELCRRLGYLPLAVEVAGANLQRGVRVAEFLGALRGDQGDLSTLDLGDSHTREQSVATCFEISAAHLPSDADRERYALLGVLAPEAPYGAREAGIVWGLESDDPAIPPALRTLADHALIEPLLGGKETRYRQHALLRQHARGHMQPEALAEAELRHAARLCALVSALAEQGELNAMDPFYPQALIALQRAGRTADDAGRTQARALLSGLVSALSGYWSVRGLFALQRDWNERAADAAHALGDVRAEGVHLGNLGLAYAALGEVPKAIEHHQQALAIDRQIGDMRGEGRDMGHLGNAYLRLGEVPKAIEHHQQALAVARRIGDRQGEGSHLGNLGNAYLRLGEVPKAIGYYEQALGIARQIRDKQMEGYALGSLGSAYVLVGELPAAIEHCQQALAIDRQIGDVRGEGQDLANLGVAYRRLGEVPKAIGYYEQALAIARQIGDKQGEGNALGNLGNAYADLGEVRKTIGYREQALAIARQIGDRQVEGNVLFSLGLAAKRQGDLAAARAHLASALALFEAMGLPEAEKARNALRALDGPPGPSPGGPGT